MLDARDRLTRSSRWVVQIAIVTNRVFFFAVVLGLLSSCIFATRFSSLLIQPTSEVAAQSELIGLRWLLLLGVAMAITTEILLVALARIIASTSAGDPFIVANAHRLQTIGWALLTLQLLDIPGAMIARLCPSLGSAAPDVSFSPGGWIAVLMVFVLSRVFAAGSAMRDDLEGTV